MSKIVREILQRRQRMAVEADQGTFPALGMRMTAGRFANLNIISVARLPAAKSTPSGSGAQINGGSFQYNSDYSHPDGDDIGTP